MAHTPGFPSPAHRFPERVRNDGHWITGDPLDMDYRPWKSDGRLVLGVPTLSLIRAVFDIPVPEIPGWKTPTTGFAVEYSPMVMRMEYTPMVCNDPNAKPEQLHLFDF